MMPTASIVGAASATASRLFLFSVIRLFCSFLGGKTLFTRFAFFFTDLSCFLGAHGTVCVATSATACSTTGAAVFRASATTSGTNCAVVFCPSATASVHMTRD